MTGLQQISQVYILLRNIVTLTNLEKTLVKVFHFSLLEYFLAKGHLNNRN